MASKGYIDIHTHNIDRAGYTLVRNLYSDFDIAESGVLCSLGIHPWYIRNEDLELKFKELSHFAAKDNVVAIGECGLDKVTETDWSTQVRVFKMQVGLAVNINKPLIIHCVKAYEDVLRVLKSSMVRVPVIFHGYNKKWQLAEQLLNEGYFLSFGAAILKDNVQVHEALFHTPVDKFFLETDDSNADIEDIYMAAAAIRKTPLDTIILQVQKNYETVFTR